MKKGTTLMKIIADLHTHTIASRHAYSTLKENIEQAQQIGLEYLGISDHTPGMPDTTCEGHFHNLKVLRKRIGGLRILKGAEANIMDAHGRIDLSEELMSRLDYVIASLHDLVLGDMGIAANTKAVIQAMTNPHVRIIGHPDDDHFPLDYKALAAASKVLGVALELNNSSLSPNSSRSGGYENARRMLEQCKLMGATVMVVSDSHIWYDVGEFGYATALLKDCEFPPELVINSDRARFEAFMNVSEAQKISAAIA